MIIKNWPLKCRHMVCWLLGHRRSKFSETLIENVRFSYSFSSQIIPYIHSPVRYSTTNTSGLTCTLLLCLPGFLTHTHTHTFRTRLKMKQIVLSTTWSKPVHPGCFWSTLSSRYQPINESSQGELWGRGVSSKLFSSFLYFFVSSFMACLFLSVSSSSVLLTLSPSLVESCLCKSALACVSLFPSGLSVILWPWPSPELLHKYLLSCWQAHTHINPFEGGKNHREGEEAQFQCNYS